jgi:hypothetical protein
MFEKEDELDFEKDLQINIDNLDQHLLDQAELYGKWSRLSAEASRDVNIAKLELRETEACISIKVRKSPEIYGFEKRATEAGVESIIHSSPEYRKAYLNWVAAVHRSEILESAKWSVQQRGHSLQELVKLWMNNYMSSSNVSGQSRDMQSDLAQHRQREALNRSETTSRLKLKAKGASNGTA